MARYGAVSYHQTAAFREQLQRQQTAHRAANTDASQRLRFHECGHAVVAYALGARVLDVALDTDGGFCGFERPASDRDQLVIAVAGVLGEGLYDDCPRDRQHGAGTDLEAARTLLGRIGGDHQQELDLAQDRAYDLITRHSAVIRELVHQMAAHGDRLDEQQIARIFRSSGLPNGASPPRTSAPPSRVSSAPPSRAAPSAPPPRTSSASPGMLIADEGSRRRYPDDGIERVLV